MATHDWQSLGTLWYRRQELFEMQWTDQPKRLEYCTVAADAFGGLIATVRNEKIMQPVKGPLSNELQIFTPAGTKLSSAPWRLSGLLAMGWSPDVTLICVFQNGSIHTFSAFCEPLLVFSFDERIRIQGGLLQALVVDEGIAAVTSRNEVVFNTSFTCNRYYKLPEAELTSPPLVMCAFPLPSNEEGQMEAPAIGVLISTEDGKLHFFDQHKKTKLSVGESKITQLSLSRSKKHVACLAQDGTLYIFATADMRKTLEMATFELRKQPREMQWCADDCVAMYVVVYTPSNEKQHMLYLGGPKSQWLPYQFSSPLHLIPEVDGLRIVSAYSSEFMQRVPPQTEAIFSIGSCQPPAMLCYAMERYDYNDISTDESLRAIKDKLGEAVDACVTAATYEWDVDQIKALLKAAVFGRHFLDAKCSFNSMIEACRNIRICLAIRCAPLWMPLTVSQLNYLSIKKVIHRILQCHQHMIAYGICKYVGYNWNFVLIHWASEKFKHSSHLNDEQLCRLIHQKFEKAVGISYADVAYMAAQSGRGNLASALLDYEPYARTQVRMLLKLQELNLGLEKAVISKDCDLIFECIGAICSTKNLWTPLSDCLTELIKYLRNRDFAKKLFIKFCLDTNNLEVLQQLFERLGEMPEAGLISVRIAYQKDDWEQHKSWLSYAAGFIDNAKGKTENSNAIGKAAIANQIDLLNVQTELEAKANANYWFGGPHNFRGLSLMQTIRSVVIKNHLGEADRLQKLFKVSDKHFWHCKVNALAEGERCHELFAMATSVRTPPIGYEPFLQTFLTLNQSAYAVRLIPKLKDADLEHKWYTKFGLLEEAENAQKRFAAGASGAGLLQSISDVLTWKRG